MKSRLYINLSCRQLSRVWNRRGTLSLVGDPRSDRVCWWETWLPKPKHP